MNTAKLTQPIAQLILSRPNGFHAWDFPAGDANAERRQKVIDALMPELRTKRGIVPRSKCSVTLYRKAILEVTGTVNFEEALCVLQQVAA